MYGQLRWKSSKIINGKINIWKTNPSNLYGKLFLCCSRLKEINCLSQILRQHHWPLYFPIMITFILNGTFDTDRIDRRGWVFIPHELVEPWRILVVILNDHPYTQLRSYSLQVAFYSFKWILRMNKFCFHSYIITVIEQSELIGGLHKWHIVRPT